MPTILRVHGFWFYEADLQEPPHVHVSKDGNEAKFWLSPIEVARSGRFRGTELRIITRIIDENREFLMAAWEKENSKRANG